MPELDRYAKHSEPNMAQWNINVRRWVGRYLAQVVLPNEIHVRDDSAEKLTHLVEDDHSVLALYSHLTEDDQARLLSSLYIVCPALIPLPAYTPVAYHVYDKSVKFADPFGIESRAIVTEDTVFKGKNIVDELDDEGKVVLDSEGQAEKVALPEHTFEKIYVKEGRERMASKAFVFVAPQLKRDTLLRPSNKRPVEILLRGLPEDTKVAIVFIGLGFKNENIYQQEDYSAMHIREKFVVEIGPVFTRQELVAAAKEKGLTIDEFTLWQLGQNVPAVYNGIPEPTPHSQPSPALSADSTQLNTQAGSHE